MKMNRRDFILSTMAGVSGCVGPRQKPQRVIVFLVDGLGSDYIAASEMPVLAGWARRGFRKTVQGVMPSVTNANNTSVCCGTWPAEHGITANFFLDAATGQERYMESADLVLRPTLFERAAARGVRSALLSAKEKTITLLPRGAAVVLSAENPDASRVADGIATLPGVEGVLSRDEAARRFRLMPSRIGEVVVLGNRGTVFGGLDTEMEILAPEYRSHGGSSEAEVPLVVYNAERAPAPAYFQANVDLARWLFV